MNSIWKKQQSLSLQAQYLFFSAALGVVIILAIAASHVDSSRRYQKLNEQTELTSEMLSLTLNMRDHTNTLVTGIAVIMLEPEFLAQIDLIYDASFTEIKQSLEKLKRKNLADQADISEQLKTLSQNLNAFHLSSTKLFEIRTTIGEQYPAMAISTQELRPAMREIKRSINTAIEIFESAGNSDINNDQYHLLKHAQFILSELQLHYRAYVINRLGSFEVDQLFDQELKIDQLVRQFEIAAAKLQKALPRIQFDHHPTQLSVQIAASFKQWKHGFQRIKIINHSTSWRQDAELMRVSVLPLLDNVNDSLVTIDRKIEYSNAKLIQELLETGTRHSLLLIFIALLIFFYSFISFLFFKHLLFKPMTTLAKTVRSNELELNRKELKSLAKSKETRVLIDSFLAMNDKVLRRQKELTHLALHDSLTSLPNRKLLLERLQHDIEIADRGNTILTFMMLDLDGFKEVNDTLGHHIGDQLLIKVGHRLKKSLRSVDTIARLGGDEFSIILPNDDREGAGIVADKINELMSSDFKVGDAVLNVSVSIGITQYPEDGEDVNALMQHADVAMYQSKQNKTSYHCYDSADDDHSIQRLSLSRDLREAIENDMIELHYQPKLMVSTMELMGVETLLRWKHPESGYISPERVIEIAEHSGLIDELSLLIFNNAVLDFLLLKDSCPQLNLAINLSVHNLKNKSFLEDIKGVIQHQGMDPSDITFEITESAMMADPEQSIETLTHLSAMGIKISVDDFGTGFSSLAYLKKLPVSELKIDRSFVHDMLIDKSDAVIVQSTIDLGHNLGLIVVAEGVENKAALNLLDSMNCDITQGYYFSKPLKFEDIEKWISDELPKFIDQKANNK